MLNSAWRNNTLVAAHTVGTASTAHARWYQIDTSGASPVISQSGEVNQGSGVATYFPTIEIDSNGDLGMSFMQSSSSTFMSMYVTGRTPSDATGTMETPVRVANGQANYTGTRAGDFSGITVDPANTTTFWAANEWKPSSAFWGTYVASFSVQAQVGVTHFSVVPNPSSTTAGSAVSVTVSALDASNNVVPTYTGTIHFTSSDTNSTLPADYTFVSGDNGVHVFTNGVTLRTAGNQTVTTTDTSNSSLTGSGTVTVNPGIADHLAYGQQPTDTPVNAIISPAVTVRVLDQFNNLLTGDNSDQVSLAIGTNPGGGTLGGTNPVTVSGGVATFSNLTINQIGNGYTLVASSGSLAALTSNTFNITTAAPTVIEGFESGNLNSYTRVGGTKLTAKASTIAKHDGTYGLQDSPGQDWIYRNDAPVHTQQGDRLQVWMQFATKITGRAYFGFGASASGTLSLVAAGNTNQLILEDNSGYNLVDLAAVSQTYLANHWYRMQVEWGSTGTITGKLFDSDGTTLLSSVTATTNVITSGGIAFRAIGNNPKYFDTVTRTAGVNRPSPGGAIAPDLTRVLGQARTESSEPLANPANSIVSHEAKLLQAHQIDQFFAHSLASQMLADANGAVHAQAGRSDHLAALFGALGQLEFAW